MPGKKKKGGKKKGGKKKKEYLPPLYDIPKYEDPELLMPKVNLLIKLSDPPSEIFNFKFKLPINTRLNYLCRLISQKHQKAILDISLFKDRFNPKDVLDLDSTLEDYRIFGDSEYILYYEFKITAKAILA